MVDPAGALRRDRHAQAAMGEAADSLTHSSPAGCDVCRIPAESAGLRPAESAGLRRRV